jgi:hypothetical protein
MKSISVFSGVQMKWLAILAGVCCLSFAAVASAEQAEKSCADDAAKLCNGVEKGEGRVAKCLKEHKDELSPGCKKNIHEMKEKTKEMKEACKDDAKKLCKDAKPGGGRIMQCLKQHESDLSPECKEEMGHRRDKK